MLFVSLVGLNLEAIIFSIIMIFSIAIELKLINNNNIDYNRKVFIFLFIALCLRVLWLLNANSIPISDFKTMYESAGDLINGNTKIFKGISYLARFPHLTITVLYMTFIRIVFPVDI